MYGNVQRSAKGFFSKHHLMKQMCNIVFEIPISYLDIRKGSYGNLSVWYRQIIKIWHKLLILCAEIRLKCPKFVQAGKKVKWIYHGPLQSVRRLGLNLIGPGCEQNLIDIFVDSNDIHSAFRRFDFSVNNFEIIFFPAHRYLSFYIQKTWKILTAIFLLILLKVRWSVLRCIMPLKGLCVCV